MKRSVFWLTALFCLLAANITTAEETKGFLVRLKPTAALTIEHEDGYVLDQLKYAPQFCRVESMEELETYIGMENVEYVEEQCELELFDMPDDPYYEDQWAYTELKAEYARLADVDGDDVRVAVIDSGIRLSHEEFEGADIADGENFARVSVNNLTVNADDLADRRDHGTSVASVIAAQTDNGLGGCGIAPGVTLVPFRVFSETEARLEWAVQAIYAAVDEYDCDVINMSFGIASDKESLREAVEYAYDNGVIVVSSAGNYGGTTLYYPAAYDCVIGVGAMGKGRVCSDFSQHNDSVFITAPGDDMVTAESDADDAYSKTRSGTSFSSPVIAGMAALALQADPTLTPDAFMDLLVELAEDLGDEGWDEYYGNGFVEIDDLLQKLEVELETPAVTSKNGKTKIYGHFTGYTPLEGKTVILGGYDAEGKMISLDMTEYTVDKHGVLTVDAVFEQALSLFERIRLFRMDGSAPAEKLIDLIKGN